MAELLVAGVQPLPGALSGPASRLAPGSAAAWPGDGRRDRDGPSFFCISRAGSSGLLEWRSRRRVSARSTERGCTRTPKACSIRPGSCAGRSAGSASSCSLAQARIRSASLLAMRGPVRAGSSPSSPRTPARRPRRSTRGGRPERRGGLGHRGAAGPDLAHDLDLDPHRVLGVDQSLPRYSGSVTCSGRGSRHRAAASAASLGSCVPWCPAMPPPHPDQCQTDFAEPASGSTLLR